MISVVIATKNRSSHVEYLLDQISHQSLLPIEVIIIDASDEFTEFNNRDFPFPILHTQSSISSTAIQRNIGLNLVSVNAKYIAILDDDTYPDKNYFSDLIESMIHTDSVGVSGIAIPKTPRNQSTFLAQIFKYFFLLDHWNGGTITRGGINVPVLNVNSGLIKVDWLIGCSIYNIEKITNLRFDSSLYGYGLFDDVIFSLQASRNGDLYVDTRVTLKHIELSIDEHKSSEFWYKWTHNRKKVVNLLYGKRLKWLSYCWSNLGQFLIIFFNYKSGKLEIFCQMILGMFQNGKD